MAYDRGQLEIMAPSYERENVKCLIGRLVEVYTEELGVDLSSAGSTTLSREDLDRGIEPDECYYIAGAPRVRAKKDIDLPVDPPPDLAVDVDITGSSVDKLAICAALGIREVWRYDGAAVHVEVLQEGGRYKQSAASVVLPGFPFDQLSRLLAGRGARSETRIARDFRQWIRDHLRPRAADR
jgi:Uma2 family endonuclease